MLSKEQILAADDLKHEVVHVPEWGGDVHIRVMTGTERDRFEASVGVGGQMNLANIRARLLSLVVCDESGKRLFADADVEALGAKSGAALDRLFAAAQRLNGLSKQDIEELQGN